MPILEMVAGEAHDRSCDSNRKLMLGPNWILSPEGIVSSLQKVMKVKIRKRTERSHRRIANKGICFTFTCNACDVICRTVHAENSDFLRMWFFAKTEGSTEGLIKATSF